MHSRKRNNYQKMWVQFSSRNICVSLNENQNTIRYQLTPVRLAIIKKKSTYNKSWRGCVKKRTFLYCLWECKLIQPLQRTIWRFFGKLGINLLCDPKIPLLGIYPEENHNFEIHMYPSVHCSMVYNSQDMEATQCPLTDE